MVGLAAAGQAGVSGSPELRPAGRLDRRKMLCLLAGARRVAIGRDEDAFTAATATA
jgi:hypothetical protein